MNHKRDVHCRIIQALGIRQEMNDFLIWLFWKYISLEISISKHQCNSDFIHNIISCKLIFTKFLWILRSVSSTSDINHESRVLPAEFWRACNFSILFFQRIHWSIYYLAIYIFLIFTICKSQWFKWIITINKMSSYILAYRDVLIIEKRDSSWKVYVSYQMAMNDLPICRATDYKYRDDQVPFNDIIERCKLLINQKRTIRRR